MADTVQYLLEEQLPELEDYERKGYFTKAELKQIIARRRDFEYKLKRRAALKIDFYRYIEYESKLEELRRHRKSERRIKGKKGPAETAIVQHIHFIFDRATRKFKSDLQLWLDWLAFCRKAKSTKKHSKVVTKALQRHATVPVLWVEAASWEFERNGDVGSARALMQQGLRMCKHEEVMWVEYLRMELLYIERLRARRVVLGLDVPQEAQDAPEAARKLSRRKKQKAGATEGQDEGGEEGEEGAGKGKGAGKGEGEGGDEAEAAVRAVLTGAVARIVIRNAVAALPRSLSLRTALLRVLARFSFPGVREMEAEVYDGIAADFPADEDAWEVLARRPLAAAADAATRARKDAVAAAAAAAAEGAQGKGGEGAGGERERERDEAHPAVCEVYRRAVRAVASDKMYGLYARYLEQRLQGLMDRAARLAAAAGDADANASASAGSAEQRQKQAGAAKKKGGKRGRSGNEDDGDDATHAAASSGDAAAAAMQAVVAAGAELLAVYGAAHAAKAAGAQLYSAWLTWASKLGQARMALSAAKQGTARHPTCVELWCGRMDLEAAAAGTGAGGGSGTAQEQQQGQVVLSALQQALGSVKTADSTPLWLKALQHVPPASPGFSRLCDLLVTAVSGSASGPSSGGLGKASAAMLQRIRDVQGLEAARAFYRRFLALPAPGGEFFHAAIAMERHEEGRGASTSTQPANGTAAAAAAGRKAATAAASKARAGASGGSSHVRQLFEAAVACYGSVDEELWLEYARYEAAGLQGAGHVYWRATKALSNPDTFIARYQEALLG